MLNKIRYKILARLLGKLCMKSGGCRSCPARIGPVDDASFSCAHGYIHEQALKVYKMDPTTNPLERSK